MVGDAVPETLVASVDTPSVVAAAPASTVAAPVEWSAAAPELTQAPTAVVASTVAVAPGAPSAWEAGLQAEARSLLEAGRTDVWDVLTRRFETGLILTALANTRGRRIEAAHKLGIGRNTITRKIQELNLE